MSNDTFLGIKKANCTDEIAEKAAVSESALNDLLYEIDAGLMKRVYFALETGRDNALEVYNDHMNRLGKHPMTNRNKYLAECLKKDIDEVESIIDTLNSKWEFGV